MNLLEDPWLPIRRQSGVREKILPWQITDQIDDDPVVALDVPRPDFNGSLIQFLIGLIQTAWMPEDDVAWGRAYETAPSPATLRDACLRYRDAFQLDGDGPRFLQDLELTGAEVKGIGALLIDEPGANALRKNGDLFVKRGQYPSLGITATIAALITLQTNAPQGGRGQLTSLRGGGPLTTLVIPDPLHDPLPVNLWRLVWSNVLPAEVARNLTGNLRLQEAADIFPWLAPTRTSESPGGVDTTPEDAHPLQMYWGMPRRIRLELDDLPSGECPLTFERGPLVSGYQTRPSGVNYTGAWAHPLSPHGRSEDGQPLPLHPQPGGIGYRHWLGLVLGDEQGVAPARVVLQADASLARQRRRTRLWAFGYDMDKKKARCWYESVMPIYHLAEDQRERFMTEAGNLLFAAAQVAGNLRSALKKAWFSPGATVRGELGFVTEAFWHDTEEEFFALMDALHQHVTGAAPAPDRREWLRVLNNCAMRLFDSWAASGALEDEDPRRIAIARNELGRFNHSRKIKARLGIEANAA
jgi:CRISPR system Cascade subunit CasA